MYTSNPQSLRLGSAGPALPVRRNARRRHHDEMGSGSKGSPRQDGVSPVPSPLEGERPNGSRGRFHFADGAKRANSKTSISVRDCNMITGQQRYSGVAAARLVIQARPAGELVAMFEVPGYVEIDPAGRLPAADQVIPRWSSSAGISRRAWLMCMSSLLVGAARNTANRVFMTLQACTRSRRSSS